MSNAPAAMVDVRNFLMAPPQTAIEVQGTFPYEFNNIPLVRCQKVSRLANWNARGSPTAVVCPNTLDGFDGYAPAPKLPLTDTTLVRFVRLNASAIASTRARAPMRNVRLTRAPR